jgi:transcriptional regulator with GAF, ATPase, and Fis domain
MKASKWARSIGSIASVLEPRTYHALALSALGRSEEALRRLDKAIEDYASRSPFHARLGANLARVEIAMGGPGFGQEGRAALEQVLQVARAKKMGWQLAYALTLTGAARVMDQKADEDPEPPLREAIAIGRKICDRTIEWEAHYWLGRAFERRLKYEQALRCYRISALTINELALNIDEDRYRKSFLEQPKVREVLSRYRRLRREVGKRARHDLAILSRSERTSRRMLDALSQVGQKLTSVLDLDELLRSVLDLSIENVRAERGMIFLREETTGALRLEASRGMDGESLDDAATYSTSVVRQVAEGRTLLTIDVGKEPSLAACKSLVLHQIKSILCVPMRSRGRTLGVIYLDTQRAAQLFTDKERAFVESFAGQAAIAIENARLFGQLRTENAHLRQTAQRSPRFPGLVGGSVVMRDLHETIAGALATDSNVLILGESGTGKELVARALHDYGPRRERKFVAVDCGALPEGLLEAELFGHARGAFTGAERDRIGLIQEADGGTLFLDEITNTGLALQARLLRVLQEREVRRVGENTPRRVDVRFVAATNADMARLVADGRFRQDLYYRLNVIAIRVPPLRDRKEDIPLLVDHFLKSRAAQGRPIKEFEQTSLQELARHDWPGNVRELENVLERVLILAPGRVVQSEDVATALGAPGTATRPAAGRSDEGKTGEQVMIEDALRRFGGDKAKAARYIGWNRQKLYRRIKEYGIPADYGQRERKAV